MSGGSFNYVCYKVDDETQIFEALPELRNMETRLRSYGKHDAADEVLTFIATVETAQRRLRRLGKRIAPLLEAVEWWQSGDCGVDRVDDVMEQLAGKHDAPD